MVSSHGTVFELVKITESLGCKARREICVRFARIVNGYIVPCFVLRYSLFSQVQSQTLRITLKHFKLHFVFDRVLSWDKTKQLSLPRYLDNRVVSWSMWDSFSRYFFVAVVTFGFNSTFNNVSVISRQSSITISIVSSNRSEYLSVRYIQYRMNWGFESN